MNPHFIFNTLSAIQCLVIDNKTDEASEYLTELSKLIRKVLVYSREEKITLKQEKELLHSYFNLQNRRFNNKIKFSIIGDKELSDEKTLIPPMLSQPFIENALEHGQLSDIDNGEIILTFQKKEDKLIFSIEDNGVGINSAPEVNSGEKHKSIAIDITRERLKLINSGEKGHVVDLKTIDLTEEDKHGTRIEFFIPYEELN
jgi:sensor histidine kinase YesM